MTRTARVLVIFTTFAMSLGWAVGTSAAVVPEIQPDKGLVVFYRPRKTAGSAIRFNVNYAQGSLGMFNNGTMLFNYFEPGEYHFWSQVISQDGITINVEPGKVYFVEGATKMGIYAGRPKFTLVDEAKGRKEVSRL